MNNLDKATEPRDLTGYSPKTSDTVIIKSGPFPGHPVRRVPVGPNAVNIANRSVASSQNQAEYAAKRLRQKPAPSGNVGPAILKTNGIINTDQAILNLQAGANISLTADSVGDVLIASSGSGFNWPPLTIVPPVASDFTRINPSSALYIDTPQSMFIQASFTAGDLNLNSKPIIAPGITGFSSVVAGVYLNGPTLNYIRTGVHFRESSTGKIVTFGLVVSTNAFGVDRWNSPTSYNSSPLSDPAITSSNPVWFNLLAGPTNFSFSLSMDGWNYLPVYTEANTTFFTTRPDFWGTSVGNFGSASAPICSLIHWNEQSI